MHVERGEGVYDLYDEYLYTICTPQSVLPPGPPAPKSPKKGKGQRTPVKFPLNLQCNPSEQNEYGPNGCHNEDCAADNFLDGCKACMCFNNGNPSWCDGTRNEFYDTYFDQHGANPWGDRDRKNRKCNTLFRDPGSKCNSVWQCKNKKYLVCRHNECRYVDPFIYSVRGLWMMFDKALWKLRVTFCSYSSSCSSTQQLSSF